METIYNRITGLSLERVAALSDGVFAFSMTLLVVDIRVPLPESIATESALWHALLALAPRMLMYLMSFLTLGIFWNGQQAQFRHFARSDRDLTWIHLGFLAVTALMPFSTATLAEFIGFRTALIVYWFNILMFGLLLLWSWHYARKAGLLRDDSPPDTSAAIVRRIVVAQALYAFGAALCVFSTWFSIGFIILVQLNYALAPRIRPLFRL